jgi:hypothetical protein
MARGSFWSSFWRETGKNTGKWTSNKVFGSGWSTPHKFIIEKENNSDENSDKTNSSEYRDIQNSTTENARNIDFVSKDIDEISVQLDDLLVEAQNTFKSEMDPEIFKVKIRSGIVRLRRVNENVLADYYETELDKINKRHFASKSLKVIILIFVLLGLIYFGFFFKPIAFFKSAYRF